MPLSGLKLQVSQMVLVTIMPKDTINIVTHQIVTCQLQKLVNSQQQSMICSLKTPTHHSSKTNYIKRSNSIHQKSSQLMLPLLHLGFKLKNILISGLAKNIKLNNPNSIHQKSSQLMLPLLHLGFKLKNILISGLAKNIKLNNPKKIH